MQRGKKYQRKVKPQLFPVFQISWLLCSFTQISLFWFLGYKAMFRKPSWCHGFYCMKSITNSIAQPKSLRWDPGKKDRNTLIKGASNPPAVLSTILGVRNRRIKFFFWYLIYFLFWSVLLLSLSVAMTNVWEKLIRELIQLNHFPSLKRDKSYYVSQFFFIPFAFVWK